MLWLIVLAIGIVVDAATAVLRLRRGGPGPAMARLPKSLRPQANATYERHGWSAPFDEHGERRQRW